MVSSQRLRVAGARRGPPQLVARWGCSHPRSNHASGERPIWTPDSHRRGALSRPRKSPASRSTFESRRRLCACGRWTRCGGVERFVESIGDHVLHSSDLATTRETPETRPW